LPEDFRDAGAARAASASPWEEARNTMNGKTTDMSGARPAGKSGRRKVASASDEQSPAQAPRLLSGGNPQIPKGDGDGPVQAYIAAMPGWKSDFGRRFDALILQTVPGVRKAVKWNSPLYGVEGQGFFLGFHCLTKYVKVAFFRGALLDPLPPGPSKDPFTRYLDIYENDERDEDLLRGWIRQASTQPGWIP
jgi:hypothetical protein